MKSFTGLMAVVLAAFSSAYAETVPTLPEGGRLVEPDKMTHEQRAVSFAVTRGKELFDLDRAAWLATDALMVGRTEPPAIGGWIVEPPAAADGPSRVVFLDPSGAEGVYAVYVGKSGVESKVQALSTAEERTLPPRSARMARVLKLLPTTADRPCGSNPFNSVIVPPETDDGPVDAYLLSPQPQADAYFLGGHFRYRIKDVEAPLPKGEPSARSCLRVSKSEGLPKGAERKALTVSSFDAVPTEHHVFMSFSARLPVVVVTKPKVFIIAGNQISVMARNQQ
jgi:hypothetical protein